MNRRTNFQDISGQTLAGAKVLREAPSVRGLARWLCLLACGCESVEDGTLLRQYDKDGRTRVCAAHRPPVKRRRSVTRATSQEKNARENARRKALAPGKYGKGSKVCKRCGSIPWRVIASDGPTCRGKNCGLAYAPEPKVKADGEARRAL